MLDLGLLDALVAFKELINGDSVIAVIRPMFMMTSAASPARLTVSLDRI
ncbi:unnamed protein product [Penicillium camemberti]|uniref:Str. FM013 n=1 Tax=Penicillium camemberti (strain FM 013) TaxID=1429867 RepID=A0A0G4P8R4_PENC3|nr:unnamed protein product [Penicillium camemberti]